MTPLADFAGDAALLVLFVAYCGLIWGLIKWGKASHKDGE